MIWNRTLGKFLGAFLALLCIAWPCHAQHLYGVQSSQSGTLNLPVGWIELQDIFNSATCATGVTNCSFNVLPTTAGSVWIIVVFTGNNTHITTASSTGGGGTWTLCPASSCNTFNSSAGALDAIYNLGGAANTEVVSVTVSASTTGFFGAQFIELLPPPSTTASFDTSSTNSSTGCTICTGVALTTTGTDVILQVVDDGGTPTAWNACSSPYTTDHSGNCVGFNIASGTLTAPTFTQTPSSAILFSALAFKSSAGNFTTTTPLFSVVNFTTVAGAGNLNCTPTCPSITIPSTTAGNLLFVATGSTTASDTLASFTDGGDTSTACSGANITVTAASESLSCGFTVTSGGKTSVTPVMSTSGQTGFGIYELSRTGGPWTLDAQGSSQRSAPGTQYFTGQALSITGSNDACFQGFFNAGGAIGVSQFQVPFTPGAGGGDYILNTNVSEGVTLGTYAGSDAGNGTAPTWITNQNVASAVNGVCFR